MPKEILPRSNETPEELRRRASRILLKAYRKKRHSLVAKLTTKNIESINSLLEEEPLFYEDDKEQQTLVLLEPSIEENLPEDFFDNPTAWIESRKNIDRAGEEFPEGKKINDLAAVAYDVSKVKEFEVGNHRIVSKRVEKEEIKEIERAKQAFVVGIPTPKVLAEIFDKGNTYAWFERINGRNLNSLNQEASTITRFFCVDERTLDFAMIDAGVDINSTLYDQIMERWKSEYESVSLAAEFLYAYRNLVANFDEHVTSKESAEKFAILFENSNFEDLEKNIESLKLSDSSAYVVPSYEVFKNRNITVINSELEKYGSSIKMLLKDVAEYFRLVANKFPNRQRFSTPIPTVQKTLSDELNKFNIWAREKIFIDRFGYSFEAVREQKEELKKLVDKAGITHKDFADRNIILETDASGKPVLDEKGRPKLYLIDWEEGDSK